MRRFYQGSNFSCTKHQILDLRAEGVSEALLANLALLLKIRIVYSTENGGKYEMCLSHEGDREGIIMGARYEISFSNMDV